MPIIVKINPVRIEEIEIQADSQVWEDILLSIWPLVRRHLLRMNRELQEFSIRFLVHQAIEEIREKKLLGNGKTGD